MCTVRVERLCCDRKPFSAHTGLQLKVGIVGLDSTKYPSHKSHFYLEARW